MLLIIFSKLYYWDRDFLCFIMDIEYFYGWLYQWNNGKETELQRDLLLFTRKIKLINNSKS